MRAKILGQLAKTIPWAFAALLALMAMPAPIEAITNEPTPQNVQHQVPPIGSCAIFIDNERKHIALEDREVLSGPAAGLDASASHTFQLGVSVFLTLPMTAWPLSLTWMCCPGAIRFVQRIGRKLSEVYTTNAPISLMKRSHPSHRGILVRSSGAAAHVATSRHT